MAVILSTSRALWAIIASVLAIIGATVMLVVAAVAIIVMAIMIIIASVFPMSGAGSPFGFFGVGIPIRHLY